MIVRRYVVACLAGHGIGPEVTAAASRTLARLGAEHGFLVEELHPPFDTEALTRSGHHLPVATREATASADAVLVAGDAAPALDGLRAALESDPDRLAALDRDFLEFATRANQAPADRPAEYPYEYLLVVARR